MTLEGFTNSALGRRPIRASRRHPRLDEQGPASDARGRTLRSTHLGRRGDERSASRPWRDWGRGVLYTTALFFALFAALPFAWMILTIFKQNTDLYNPNNNPFLFNDPPTLDNITYLFEKTNYLTFVRNTLIVSVLVVIITLHRRGARRLQPDAAGRALGRGAGHRHLPRLPGAADAALHPALAGRRGTGPAQHAVGDGAWSTPPSRSPSAPGC